MEQFAKRMHVDIDIVKQKQSCVISLAQYILFKSFHLVMMRKKEKGDNSVMDLQNFTKS